MQFEENCGVHRISATDYFTSAIRHDLPFAILSVRVNGEWSFAIISLNDFNIQLFLVINP
jgi:hypothetical protein